MHRTIDSLKPLRILSGVLSSFHPSVCSCTRELSATERRQAGQSSPILYDQQSTGPTCTQRRHIKACMATLADQRPFQQSRNTLLPKYLWLNYLWMATRVTKTATKVYFHKNLSAYGIYVMICPIRNLYGDGDVIVWFVEMPSPREQSNSAMHTG